MGWIVGIDEAGLGPNLGPFVVSAVVWRVPDCPRTCDLWAELQPVVTSDLHSSDQRLVIADSKTLFQPHQGLARLERSVWGLLRAAGLGTTSLRALDEQLQLREQVWDHDPWRSCQDLPLPTAVSTAEPDSTAWGSLPVELCAIRSLVVHPAEFNRRLEIGNKSELVTRCHFELLRSLKLPWEAEDILVYSDKHGGRNRYAGALADHWDGAWIEIVAESAELSAYRLGKTELRFEPRAERHLPVACASMVSKYLRELHMMLFNRFWQGLVPQLKPTQGYPLDARRFAREIEAARFQRNLPLDQLWRQK